MTLDGAEIDKDAATHALITTDNALRMQINQYNALGSFNTYYDEIAIINRTLTSSEINELTTTYIADMITTGSSSGGEFNIAARTIDSAVIYNFTVTIKNSTMSRTNTTMAGALKYTDLNGLFNISFSKVNDSGGFYNRTYSYHNTSADLTATLYQSFININVSDILTNEPLATFTARTNWSEYSGTNGYVLAPSKPGTYLILNVTSSIYPKIEMTYQIGALQNITLFVNASPLYNVSIRREADGSVFDWASTNETKLTVRCANKAIVYYFNESDSVGPVIDCQFVDLKLDVSYSTGDSYFRTLIPSYSETNVTFFLIDLNLDTAVQKIVELIDLTGEWQEGVLRAQTPVGAQIEDIIEMQYDVSSAVTLYLKKDNVYSLTLISNDGTKSRAIGNLVADSAGTISITYPPIEYFPEVYLYDDISIDYTFNVSASILRLQYLDASGNTTYVRWRIYNATNSTNPLLLQTFTSTATTGATFTYGSAVGNTTYMTELFVQHNLLDFNITDTQLFYDYDTAHKDVLPGFTDEETDGLLFWGCFIFLVIWGLLFSAKHAGIGAASVSIWTVIFRSVGWFPISWVWVGFIGLVAVITFSVEAMKK